MRIHIGLVNVNQRAHVVVPGPHEGEQGHHRQGRLDQGHDDVPQRLQFVGPVDARSVRKLVWNGAEELPQHEDGVGAGKN